MNSFEYIFLGIIFLIVFATHLYLLIMVQSIKSKINEIE
jgi:hypothetical protein